MLNISHLERLWNLHLNIISISNIQLTITHKGMEWLSPQTIITPNHEKDLLHSKKPPSPGKKRKQAKVLKYYFLYGKLGQRD